MSRDQTRTRQRGPCEGGFVLVKVKSVLDRTAGPSAVTWKRRREVDSLFKGKKFYHVTRPLECGRENRTFSLFWRFGCLGRGRTRLEFYTTGTGLLKDIQGDLEMWIGFKSRYESFLFLSRRCGHMKKDLACIAQQFSEHTRLHRNDHCKGRQDLKRNLIIRCTSPRDITLPHFSPYYFPDVSSGNSGKELGSEPEIVYLNLWRCGGTKSTITASIYWRIVPSLDCGWRWLRSN
jgi:hypothetical protein